MRKKFNLKTKISRPDYLTILSESGPLAWSLIRANEIKSLEDIDFKPPVLDIGCGDGTVAKVVQSTRKGSFEWGIDLSSKEVDKARHSGSYKHCKVANIYKLPFRDDTFNTVFSNSVIEHLTDLDSALSEISRVLTPGGKFIMTVPSAFLSKYLLVNRFLMSLRLSFLANLYARLFHNFFKHYNVYNHDQWRKILAKHDFTLIDHYYYHSRQVIQAHEVFSYIAIPQHLIKLLTGSWPKLLFFRGLLLNLFLKNDSFVYDKSLSKKEGGSLLLIFKWSG